MDVLRNLDKIATAYSVFEKDQVLTEAQLNSLPDYLDDQIRLTRVELLGVGISCGLHVSLQANKVIVTKGAGVTTDGDLLFLKADTAYDRFKPYDKSAPVYAPFYAGENMLPVFELVAEGESDARASTLDQFAAQTQLALDDMVALMLMESCQLDNDLCAETDCDNLGKDAVHNTKVLLIGKTSLASLKENLPTAEGAAHALDEVFADRATVPGGIALLKDLATAYRTPCNSMHQKLSVALAKIYPACNAVLGAVFPSDPSPVWIQRLNDANTFFDPNKNVLQVQYYYDFLKDVVETYAQFRHLLFGETTVCGPDIGSFPKHLLLGNLSDTDNRTGFYPSPMVSPTVAQWAHARLLAWKLHAMISNFKFPIAAGPIRITPSLFEDRCLEERAIPYYYAPDAALPIEKSWSYANTQRGMQAYNYSYNAQAFGAVAAGSAAATPFSAQIGRYPFFRIEGHQGRQVSEALKFLQGEIASRNLPFAVRALALSADKTKISIKPPIRYTDLHRLHYMLRQEVVNQLDDAVQFSGKFTAQVNTAVDQNLIGDADNHGIPVKTTAADKHQAVVERAGRASGKLNLGFSAYRKDAAASWKSDIKDTVQNAGEYKFNLGQVVKTEFTTPFDTLIGSTHARWIDWLDGIIKTKDDKEDDKLLFANFQARNPGLEHCAGVLRAGTFVLVYDESNTVVADFMLPYYSPEEAEAEPAEPPLPKPDIQPGLVLDKPIRVMPFFDRPLLDQFVQNRFTGFQAQLQPLWQKDIGTQKDLFQVFKDTVANMGTVFSGANKANTTTVGFVADPMLDLRLKDVQNKMAIVDSLQSQSLAPDLDPQVREAINAQLASAQQDLAKTVTDATQTVADSKIDVSAGSDGFVAMNIVSEAVGKLNNEAAVNQVSVGLRNVSAAAPAPTQQVIGNIMTLKGLAR